MKIKLLLLLITTFSVSALFGQASCDFEEIPHPGGCDSNGKWIQGFELGTRPLKLDSISVIELDNGIRLSGKVVDGQNFEMMSKVPIYSMITDPINCKILQQIGITNGEGQFKVHIALSDSIGVYFQTLSYEGLELKIKDCH